MRRIITLLLLAMALSAALPAHSQRENAPVTMSFDNERLPAVLLRLEKVSTYKFLFTYDDLQKFTVSGSVRRMPFMDAVRYVLREKPVDMSIDGKFIHITLNTNAQQQGKKLNTIGGYVYDDATREPIIGAQVKIPGTNIATVTDVEGAFHLNYYATADTRIQVSYIGMKTMVVPVKGEMHIGMKSDTKELEGVVVTGIFRKARESYTGSVSSVTSDQLKQYRGANLLQTLKNVDASINFSIDNINGSNPNNLPNLNIRGNSSLPMSVEQFNQGSKTSPNTPLIIMDGFEISLQKLMDYNDEDIESINILKDAAATAIYGSKGANGVIVVVSRLPEPGRLRVNVEAGVQLEVPDLTSYHLMNAREKLELERRAGLYDKPYSPTDNSTMSDILYKQAYNKRLRDVLSGVDTDWLSKPLRTGVGQRFNLRLEGGSKEFRWAVDTRYNNVQGAMKGSGRKNFNGAITLLYKYRNLTFRNYTSVGVNNATESPYGSFGSYARQQPYNAPYDKDGNLVKSFGSFDGFSPNIENPLYNASLGSFDKNNYLELTDNFSVDWNILPELNLRGQLGITKNDSESNFFRSPDETLFYLSKFDVNTYANKLLIGGLNTQARDSHYVLSESRLNDLFASLPGSTASHNRYMNLWNRTLKNPLGKSFAGLKKYWFDENKAAAADLMTRLQIVPMLWLSEVYLVAMEAYTSLDELLSLYKTYMTDREYTLYTPFKSLDEAKAELVNEIRRELIGEGQVFYAYKRLGLKSILWNKKEMTADDYVLPLPSSEYNPNQTKK